jgi:hypothetical protein
VSKYQEVEHTDVEGNTRKMSHENIVKDFGHHIGRLIKEGKHKEARELRNRFNKWKDDNLHRDKKLKYYKMEDVWKKDK